MPDALLDLLLGSRCAVCGRPGRVLCPRCRRDLPRGASTCWPTPCPPGLARPVAAGEYAGPLKLLVNAHKEEHTFALAGPLGDLLATSALSHADPGGRGGAWRIRQVVLVPVPSRAAVVRRRGHDPLLRIALRATSRLRRAGVPAVAARLLRTVKAVEDQAGLGAAERRRNLAGTMACRPGACRAREAPDVHSRGVVVVVVDDVITTGATVREAQRALEAGGVAVSGIAVVAATRRTSVGPLDHPGRRARPP